jgi:putative ABC transport system substrate-binding protein
LRDLGYIEGGNLVIERRYADGKLDQLPVFARELVICASTRSSQWAVRNPGREGCATTIPIVLFTGGDPVATGFVPNLARPEATSRVC